MLPLNLLDALREFEKGRLSHKPALYSIFICTTTVERTIEKFADKAMAENSGKSAFYSNLNMYDFLYVYNCCRADIGESLPDKVLAEGIGPQLATAYFNLKMNQVGAPMCEASRMRSLGHCTCRMHSLSL
jgi:hypothetical protein